MSDSSAERVEAHFMSASPNKLDALRQSFCVTEFSPFILLHAAAAVSLVLWMLIFSVI